MSLDLFVFAILRDGQLGRFPRAIVEGAFAPYVQDVKHDYWHLHLRSGEETSATMLVKDEELIDRFSINRPPGYEGFPEFWDSLYEVLRQTCAICILLGVRADPNCCVANPQVLDELPGNFVENWGRAVCSVTSGTELETALWS
jgi:hypothetical protein